MASVANAIRAAAATAVSALSLTPTPTVKARKRPTLPAGVAPPAVVVSVGDAGAVEVLVPGKVLVRYPLTVAAYVATDGRNQSPDTLETWRQAIGRALDSRAAFAAAGDVNDVERADETVFDPPPQEDGYDVSFQRFIVEMIEDRN